MKKMLGVGLTFLLIMALMVTGCSNNAPASNQNEGTKTQEQANGEDTKKEPAPIELTMWHETEESIANVIREELKKLEPEIKVNVERKEKVTEALKLVGNDPNSAPDLFWYAHDKIGLLATMGVLEPLDQHLPLEKYENFIPMTKKAATFNGKVYQVPVYFETLLYMYNKKLLDQVPKTTDDLLAMMKEKTRDGNYGYVEQHSTAYYAAAWINGFGGYIINEKGEPGLNKQETMDAIAYHKEFVPYMPKDGEWNTVNTLFNEGKAASTLNGPWIVKSAKDAGIDLGFAAPPVISKNGKPLSPYAGVQGIMMLKASKNKEAAAKVLKLLLEKDLGEALALQIGAAPAHQDAYKNEEVQNDALISAMKMAGQSATPMPNVPEMDIMWATTEGALVSINKNDGDVKTELEKAQKESLKLIDDMK